MCIEGRLRRCTCSAPPLSACDFCVLSSSRETYNALTNWLTDARTLASPNIVIILCGNKKDLDADREVTFLEASRFAQENGDSCLICVVPLSFSLFLPLARFSWFMTPYTVFFTICLLPPWMCAFFVCPHRADVPWDQCSDGGECRGGLSEVRSHHPQQDRLRYICHSVSFM